MDLNNLNPDEQNQAQKAFDANALKQKTLQQIKGSAPIQKFFEQFRSSSIEEFIKDYCEWKCRWYELGPNMERNQEQVELRWLNLAMEQIQVILQKQLFDLQCLWRAEKISLPEIEICYDFEKVAKNILNCSFLEPISRDDIDLYIKFLLSSDLSINSGYDDWQNYDEMKESMNTEEAFMPDWYEFHNNYTGKGSLLLLPDIRGEKEERYIDIAREEHNRLNPPKEYVPDPKLFLCFWNEEQVTEFVNRFEDKETKRWYDAYRKTAGSHSLWEECEVQENIDDLSSIEEPVPVESYYDLKEAIKIALNKYKRKKVAEALPIAYEQYLINKELFIGYDNNEEDKYKMRDFYAERILKGRALAGEPEDFNF